MRVGWDGMVNGCFFFSYGGLWNGRCLYLFSTSLISTWGWGGEVTVCVCMCVCVCVCVCVCDPCLYSLHFWCTVHFTILSCICANFLCVYIMINHWSSKCTS